MDPDPDAGGLFKCRSGSATLVIKSKILISFFKKIVFLQNFFLVCLSKLITYVNLDPYPVPDPNWAKIQDLDLNSVCLDQCCGAGAGRSRSGSKNRVRLHHR